MAYTSDVDIQSDTGETAMMAAQAQQRPATNTPEAGRVALKFFFNIMQAWGCSVTQQRTLLGGIGNTTYHKYRKLPEVRLPRDTMERISYLMGIHKALRILFSNSPEKAYEWVHKPNEAAPFNGQSALAYMLQGRVVDLADTRRYLDAVRG
ncbi:MbcA/ParS/Xre antitoxin family protein [Halomonas elongata]|uniref:MbcA/ParS/Xre antitoxin family protein n=1 Tax=Halomonas elongata TaxID=2746 RepID=UPI0023B1BA45|nr:MbcA/ParS/Xre antitoxin family protein [Halomonas elongata]